MNSTTDIFLLTRRLFHYAFVLAAFLTTAGIITANSAHAAIFVVSNTNDDGAGSFRRAVEDANDRLGPDLIKFDISGTGIKTITLQVDFAGIHSRIDIVDTVIIDGWSQGGGNYQGPPLIELRCVGTANSCLAFITDEFRPSDASNSLLRGIIISEAGGRALNISGTASQPVDHVTVQGCYIGTNASGTGAGHVGGVGILMQRGSHHQIGGAQASQRNVISSTSPAEFSEPAIRITTSDHNIIEGNYIGLDQTGSAVLRNGNGLVLFRSNDNRIGGTAPGQRNVISGNLRNGVEVFGSNNSVEGNYIGTLADGVSPAGNGNWGVVIGGDSIVPTSKNNIGGGTSAAGNVICDNGIGPPFDGGGDGGGILLLQHTSLNTIKNNLIGVGVGRTSVGNHGEGILIQDSSLNSIGGIATLGRFSLSMGNTIRFNSRAGIRIVKGGGNHLSGNSIWDNGGRSGLGIDLSPLDVLGVTANDDCDLDAGPNRLQNFPVIDRVVVSSSGVVTIEGVLRSSPPGIVSPGIPTRAGNGKYAIEFFANHACSGLGNGQGETFLGSTTVSLKPKSCSARFRTTLNVQLRPGIVITATATDSLNNTSEFSECFPVVGGGF